MNDAIHDLVKRVAAANRQFYEVAQFVADEEKLLIKARSAVAAYTAFIDAVDVGVMKEPWER
jgi:hypothetical protein